MQRVLPVLFGILFLSVPAFAIDVRQVEDALQAKTVTLPALAPDYDRARIDAYLASPAWTSWNDAHGRRWVAQYDSLTGHPRRVYGGALPWVPGAANSLTGSGSNADLERAARDFIAANGSLLGVSNASLTFVDGPATPTRDGRLRYAAFDYSINGVPVENARLLFAVNNGNMIYWHSANIAAVPTVTTPGLTADQALANLLAYAGVSAAQVEVVEQPALKLLPRNAGPGELLTYRLAYQATFRVDGGEGTWAAYVDAITGTVIAFANANRYAGEGTGKVTGGVRPAQATEPEVVRSFPFVGVETPSGTTNTTANGSFPYTGRTASTTLSGTFFDVACIDCPSQTSASSGIGRIALGVGGQDHVGNGASTPAERAAFFHSNVARSIALKWLDLPWLRNARVGVNVNLPQTCNAYWNGSSLNFFRAGAGCTNTGEIRDVMQHEWGHGIDDNDGDDPGYEAALGLGDMATGEAVGDHIALFVDHDACIGQSFAAARNTGKYITDPATMNVATCTGVRDVDELRANRGTLSTRNVTAVCPGPPISTANPLVAAYIGPMAREGHCEGEIWGQAGFHLVQNLMTGRSYGTATLDANKQHATYAGDPLPDSPIDGSKNSGYDRDQAWTLHERLFFDSRPMVASYAPSRHQAMGPSAYDGYIVSDDTGDGLLNGTPHAAYINDAFLHHGMEELGLSVPQGNLMAVDVKDCTAPATPNVTLTQQLDPATGRPAVKITWTAVANAASYSILRNERRDDVFLEVARVTSGTSVVDAGVDNGVTYHYRVQANAPGACYAVSAGGVKSISIAQPDAISGTATVTDSPRGNGNGQLDAGDHAGLYLTIRNIGLAGLTNVSASLTSSTPGVTVTKAGPRSYGSIAAGGQAGPGSWFEVDVAPDGALCGIEAVVVLNVTSAQGAFSLPVTLPIGTAGLSCTVSGTAYAQPLSMAIISDRVNGSCGDGDLVPDPGETVQVEVQVNNAGDKTANGVVATLSSDKPYLTISPASFDLGSIAAKGAETKKATFLVTVGAGAPQEDLATLTASVTSNGPTVAATRSMTTIVNRDKVMKTINYDFESGPQGWTSSDTTNGWHRTNTALTTGNMTWVWWSRYAQKRCELLYSPAMEFSATSAVALDVAYVSENSDAAWDGMNVQVSVDGGTTWITVPAGYDALAIGSGCMTANEPMFSGVSPTMKRVTADLSAFAGLRGQIRFKFSGDDLVDVAVGGAWVDNVTTSNVVISAPSASCSR
jgi:hypothetical protein